MNALVLRGLCIGALVLCGVGLSAKVGRGDFLLSNLAGGDGIEVAGLALGDPVAGLFPSQMANFFTAGPTGEIRFVTLRLSSPDLFDGSFSLDIRSDNSGSPGTLQHELTTGFSIKATDTSQLVEIALTEAISLNSGDYWLTLSVLEDSVNSLIWSVAPSSVGSSNEFTGFPGWDGGGFKIFDPDTSAWETPSTENGSPDSRSAVFAFSNSSISTVPEPGSLSLAITALCGAAAWRTKKRLIKRR